MKRKPRIYYSDSQKALTDLSGTAVALPLDNPTSACRDGRTFAGSCYLCTRQQ